MASSILAAIFSLFIPGLGQFYCGRFLRGICVFVGVSILSSICVFIATVLVWTLIIPLVIGLFLLAVWIWNIWDAYSLASRTVTY